MPKRQLPAVDTGLPIASPRETIEKTVDQLIDLLDRLDHDSDFDPSLGWPVSYLDQRSLGPAASAAAVDAELDEVDLEDDEIEDDRADREASLGATIDDATNQATWGRSDPRHPVDAEFDDSDMEDDGCREPSLAAPENDGDQTGWARGTPDELEVTGTLDDVATWPPAFRSMAEVAARRELEYAILSLAARIHLRERKARRQRRAPRRTGLAQLPVPSLTCE